MREINRPLLEDLHTRLNIALMLKELGPVFDDWAFQLIKDWFEEKEDAAPDSGE